MKVISAKGLRSAYLTRISGKWSLSQAFLPFSIGSSPLLMNLDYYFFSSFININSISKGNSVLGTQLRTILVNIFLSPGVGCSAPLKVNRNVSYCYTFISATFQKNIQLAMVSQ